MLCSNSLLFCLPFGHRGIFHQGLEPFIHYIPILNSEVDIEIKFEWCEKNQNMCEEIIDNVHDYAEFFLDEELEINIGGQVLEKINKLYE